MWDGEQLVMELSEDGEVQKWYIRGNDKSNFSNFVYADRGTGTEKSIMLQTCMEMWYSI